MNVAVVCASVVAFHRMNERNHWYKTEITVNRRRRATTEC